MYKIQFDKNNQMLLSGGGVEGQTIGFLDPKQRGDEVRAFLYTNLQNPDQGTDEIYAFTKRDLKEKIIRKIEVAQSERRSIEIVFRAKDQDKFVEALSTVNAAFQLTFDDNPPPSMGSGRIWGDMSLHLDHGGALQKTKPPKPFKPPTRKETEAMYKRMEAEGKFDLSAEEIAALGGTTAR